MKLKALKVDAKRIEQGAWVDRIPDLPGLRLRVRGLGNADDRRVQAREYDAIPRHARLRGEMSPEDQDRIMSARLLEAILVDWDGLEGEDGQPMPYSRETAEMLLTEPDYRPFRDAVTWAANVVSADRVVDEDADIKN